MADAPRSDPVRLVCAWLGSDLRTLDLVGLTTLSEEDLRSPRICRGQGRDP